MPASKLSRETQFRLWWFRWIIFQTVPFVFYHYIGGGVSTMAQPADSPLWLVCLGVLALTSFLRWQTLPKITKPATAEIVFHIGAGLPPFVCLFGLFLFPSRQLLITVLSALCVFQFIPTFARRYFPEK
jgi:hypothetical protein